MQGKVPDIQPQVQQEEVYVKWTAPSRPFKDNRGDFLTVPVVLAILIGIILLVAGEWMMIALLAALIFAYYAFSTVKPDDTEFALTSHGVRMYNRLYLWQNMARWWIEDKWDHKLAVIETSAVVSGRLVLPLAKNIEDEVKGVVSKFVLYEKPGETNLDKMGKWLAEKFPLEQKS